ncbi:MAG: energy-coupling factor ABC transporter ATP-binding protein [Desulfovibrio sp.]|jgi:cobalt/nickel transport system ATP-binding protein|nr:energy-coupling factor ABC transporter ATP-binding protein [Desulfovibrio sp.]
MDADSSPLFRLDGVTCTHQEGQAPVLADLSLALKPGECIGIVGKNGSGKSTLLHIGAGLITPERGRVLFNEKECLNEADFAEARKGLGYLLQHAEDQLFCTTVLEDVAFGPYNLGYSEARAEDMARAALADLSLSHLADRNGQRLSGGEQKLAALASILVMDVDMLFLDEPTNDLDEGAREMLMNVLERFRLPSLVVSHDLPFLRGLCTRFCRLENGTLTDLPAPPSCCR